MTLTDSLTLINVSVDLAHYSFKRRDDLFLDPVWRLWNVILSSFRALRCASVCPFTLSSPFLIRQAYTYLELVLISVQVPELVVVRLASNTHVKQVSLVAAERSSSHAHVLTPIE